MYLCIFLSTHDDSNVIRDDILYVYSCLHLGTRTRSLIIELLVLGWFKHRWGIAQVKEAWQQPPVSKGDHRIGLSISDVGPVLIKCFFGTSVCCSAWMCPHMHSPFASFLSDFYFHVIVFIHAMQCVRLEFATNLIHLL